MRTLGKEKEHEHSDEPESPVRLGALLLAEGLVTPAQLEEALRVQRAPAGYAPLGHILIAQRIITGDQLLSVLGRHRRSSKLGDILLESREISRVQLDTALAAQEHLLDGHRRSGQAA